MRRTLRSRLNIVLLQWFLLLVVASSIVLALSFAGVERSIVEDRLLLARTIARYLDATLSAGLQDLGRLADDLPTVGPEAAARLRVFRFQSPFREAVYAVDGRGRLLVSDPADVRPLPVTRLPGHEAVTPLVHKPGSEQRPVVALVRPFGRDRAGHLVAEMSPLGSMLSTFLQDLGTDPGMRIAVIDDRGVVVASPDQRQLFQQLAQASTYGERIRAHRPLVSEDLPCELWAECRNGGRVLTVMVPLQFAPWAVVIKQQRGRAFAALDTARQGLVVAGLMLAAMGLLLSRALSRSVVAPIQALCRQAAALRAGDLATPVTVTGDDEVTVLARTIDEARERLAATLGQLRALAEDLEGQVASRTAVIEAKYQDLRLLHAVAQVSTQEREPDRLVPEILRLVAAHYGLAAAALVRRRADRPAVAYVVPPDAALPWLAGGAAPPDWERREIRYQDRVEAELYHPRVPHLDAEVMGALEHQLAISLHGADLWRRTLAQDEQRQALVRRLLTATEEERRRLARELHDEISQLLTVIGLSLDHVAVDTPELHKARRLLARTQQEIHRIIHDLRPSLLDDLGLAAAMKAYADEHLSARGIAVSLEIDEALPARPEIELAIFRIYQEIVTNILRHARAEHVSVELYERDGRLVLAVEDDGVGFDADAGVEGAGITGMRERAALVNGALRIDSERGMGTQVTLEIPLG